MADGTIAMRPARGRRDRLGMPPRLDPITLRQGSQPVDMAIPALWLGRLRGVRAARAGSDRARRRYAAGLEGAVERGRDVRDCFTAAVPVSREASGAARDALLDLAERLRQPRPVRPEGVARVRRLLTDGGGPLYDGSPGELRAAAMLALSALDGDLSTP
jgi:hypothetical protein